MTIAATLVWRLGVVWSLGFVQVAMGTGEPTSTSSDDSTTGFITSDAPDVTNDASTVSPYSVDEDKRKGKDDTGSTELIRNIALGVGGILLALGTVGLKRWLRRRLRRQNSSSSATNPGFTAPAELRPPSSPALATIPENGPATFGSSALSGEDFHSRYSSYSTPYSYSNFD